MINTLGQNHSKWDVSVKRNIIFVEIKTYFFNILTKTHIICYKINYFAQTHLKKKTLLASVNNAGVSRI